MAELRELVIARAGWACDRCACPLVGKLYSLQHRRARGAGGRRGGVLDTPWNLVVLCGSGTTGCHGLVENRERETEGYARGFAIRGEVVDPAGHPIFRHLREWVIPALDDDEDAPLPSRGLWVPTEPLAG